MPVGKFQTVTGGITLGTAGFTLPGDNAGFCSAILNKTKINGGTPLHPESLTYVLPDRGRDGADEFAQRPAVVNLLVQLNAYYNQSNAFLRMHTALDQQLTFQLRQALTHAGGAARSQAAEIERAVRGGLYRGGDFKKAINALEKEIKKNVIGREQGSKSVPFHAADAEISYLSPGRGMIYDRAGLISTPAAPVMGPLVRNGPENRIAFATGRNFRRGFFDSHAPAERQTAKSEPRRRTVLIERQSVKSEIRDRTALTERQSEKSEIRDSATLTEGQTPKSKIRDSATLTEGQTPKSKIRDSAALTEGQTQKSEIHDRVALIERQSEKSEIRDRVALIERQTTKSETRGRTALTERHNQKSKDRNEIVPVEGQVSGSDVFVHAADTAVLKETLSFPFSDEGAFSSLVPVPEVVPGAAATTPQTFINQAYNANLAINYNNPFLSGFRRQLISWPAAADLSVIGEIERDPGRILVSGSWILLTNWNEQKHDGGIYFIYRKSVQQYDLQEKVSPSPNRSGLFRRGGEPEGGVPEFFPQLFQTAPPAAAGTLRTDAERTEREAVLSLPALRRIYVPLPPGIRAEHFLQAGLTVALPATREISLGHSRALGVKSTTGGMIFGIVFAKGGDVLAQMLAAREAFIDDRALSDGEESVIRIETNSARRQAFLSLRYAGALLSAHTALSDDGPVSFSPGGAGTARNGVIRTLLRTATVNIPGTPGGRVGLTAQPQPFLLLRHITQLSVISMSTPRFGREKLAFLPGGAGTARNGVIRTLLRTAAVNVPGTPGERVGPTAQPQPFLLLRHIIQPSVISTFTLRFDGEKLLLLPGGAGAASNGVVRTLFQTAAVNISGSLAEQPTQAAWPGASSLPRYMDLFTVHSEPAALSDAGRTSRMTEIFRTLSGRRYLTDVPARPVPMPFRPMTMGVDRRVTAMPAGKTGIIRWRIPDDAQMTRPENRENTLLTVYLPEIGTTTVTAGLSSPVSGPLEQRKLLIGQREAVHRRTAAPGSRSLTNIQERTRQQTETNRFLRFYKEIRRQGQTQTRYRRVTEGGRPREPEQKILKTPRTSGQPREIRGTLQYFGELLEREYVLPREENREESVSGADMIYRRPARGQDTSASHTAEDSGEEILKLQTVSPEHAKMGQAAAYMLPVPAKSGRSGVYPEPDRELEEQIAARVLGEINYNRLADELLDRVERRLRAERRRFGR